MLWHLLTRDHRMDAIWFILIFFSTLLYSTHLIYSPCRTVLAIWL